MDAIIQKNLETLIDRLSVIRDAYGQSMIVTSGLRSREDQERIYAGKKKVPYGSCHLIGAAADIADRDGTLAAFVYANHELLTKAILWCEEPTMTRGWVHFQIFPPQSGSRFFKP